MTSTFRLTVSQLAVGGDGLARYPQSHPSSGKVVFVAGALPGETVEAELTRRGRDFDRAAVSRVITPSPDRIPPPCPLFGRCGGCQLQHLAYQGQLEVKTGWIRELLDHGGGWGGLVEPTLAGPLEFGYRYRARLALAPDGRLGFRRQAAEEVVGLTDCPVLTPALNRLIGRLAPALAENPPGRNFDLQAAAGTGPDGRPAASVVFTAPGPPLGRRLRDRLLALADSAGAVGYLGRPKSIARPAEPLPGSLSLTAGSLELVLFPGVFGQAQLDRNRTLVELVVKAVRPGHGRKVLDLMAGMGNLGLPLAAQGAEVEAVEINRLAAANARHNAARLGLALRIEAAGAAEALDRAIAAEKHYDTVIVDPPRAGLGDLTDRLAALAAAELVYVSCNPATLKRDLIRLDRLGYRPTYCQPVDMFPQTFHIETVCILERKGRQ